MVGAEFSRNSAILLLGDERAEAFAAHSPHAIDVNGFEFSRFDQLVDS